MFCRFQKACIKYGVPDVDLFQSVDLFEQKNIYRVTMTIFAIGRTVRNYRHIKIYISAWGTTLLEKDRIHLTILVHLCLFMAKDGTKFYNKDNYMFGNVPIAYTLSFIMWLDICCLFLTMFEHLTFYGGCTVHILLSIIFNIMHLILWWPEMVFKPIDGFRRTNIQSGEAHFWDQGRQRRTNANGLKCNCGLVRALSVCKQVKTRVPRKLVRTSGLQERYCSENECTVYTLHLQSLYVLII